VDQNFVNFAAFDSKAASLNNKAAATCGHVLVDHDPPHPAPRHSPLRLADDTRVSRECDRITARHFVPAVWGTPP
jgi:hypothetical protein